MTTTYYAEGGKVFARTPEGTRVVTTALSTEGRDYARFQRALTIARAQREAAHRELEDAFDETLRHNTGKGLDDFQELAEQRATELVSIGEIAELTGLAIGTVYAYRKRGKLPAPDFELGVGPVWKRETIEQWNAERNRRPGPPEELLSQWRESKTGAA